MTDPHYGNVSLLLHCDGSNGSITFTDSGPNGVAVTANGNAQISTAQAKFGASGYFSGADWLTAPIGGFGANDFTIEAWVYCPAGSVPAGFATLWAHRSSLSAFGGPALVSVNASGDLQLYIANAAANGWAIVGHVTGLSLSTNAWQHLALVRSGTTLTLYKNGVAGTPATVGANAIGVTGQFSIMAGSAAGGQTVTGYLDDLRITKNVARYTADFTPPTDAFQDTGLDARAITLRPEVMGTPSPDARVVRLAVEVMMTHVLPITPQTRHLRFTGHASVDARAVTLGAEVMSAGIPEARTVRLAVEVMALWADTPKWNGPATFHEKVALLYGAAQDSVGIVKTLTGTNAIAGLNLAFEDVISTATHEYGENCIGRSAAVSIENVIRTVTFETLFPTVNTTEPLTESSLPLASWFETCGATASYTPGQLLLSNETVNDNRLTVEVQQIPENDPAKQNSYKLQDALGTVGLNLTAGKLGKFNFTVSGNPHLPIYTNRHTPDFGQQKMNVLGPIKQGNILSATITALDTGIINNFCFYKLQADSLFGFDLVQTQLSNGELFDRVPAPTAVALTVILSNENSELMVTPEYCIGKAYSMELQFGLTDYPITLQFTDLQMADYKRIESDGLVGLVIGFLNTGFTNLTFTGPATP